MKLLYLLDEWPEPANSGAKVHDKIMLRCLTEDWNADVAYWSETGNILPNQGGACIQVFLRKRLSVRRVFQALTKLLLTGEPLHTTEFLPPVSRKDLGKLVSSTSPDIIVISSPRLAVIVPYIKSVTSAKIVVDTHDVHVQRCRSIYEALPFNDIGERVKQWLLIHSYGIIEKQIYKIIDVAWALKLEDKLLLESFRSVPKVDIVPNVIDPDMVRDLLQTNYEAHNRSLSCVFIGDYSYKPNEQCAFALIEWFALDSIKATKAVLYLIGVNPSPKMMRLANLNENLCVTGEVDDLGEYYRPIDTIFLAPLLAGGGVKRKVIEAMVYGCPVITTEVGAEGLKLIDGVTAEVCPVEGFPERISSLAGDRSKRMHLAKEAQEHVNRNFGYATLRSSVRASLESLQISAAK